MGQMARWILAVFALLLAFSTALDACSTPAERQADFYGCVITPYLKEIYSNATFSAKDDERFSECCAGMRVSADTQKLCNYTHLHSSLRMGGELSVLTDPNNDEGIKAFVECWRTPDPQNPVYDAARLCCMMEGVHNLGYPCFNTFCQKDFAATADAMNACRPFLMSVNTCYADRKARYFPEDTFFQVCCRQKASNNTLPMSRLHQCSYKNYLHIGYVLSEREERYDEAAWNGFDKEVLLCAYGRDKRLDYGARCAEKGVSQSCQKFCSTSASKEDAAELAALWPHCQSEWPTIVARLEGW